MEDNWIKQLDSRDRDQRLNALGRLKDTPRGEVAPGNVNNHIHTTFSFSPYTPAAAVYRAWTAGLNTAGIMDHDSIAGGGEFVEAGHIMGLPVTCGIECRVDMEGTPFAGRLINNPDQRGCAYMAIMGVPRTHQAEMQAAFEPKRQARFLRNRKMTARIAEIMAPYAIPLDYDGDVAPLSMADRGGAVTERHILYALAMNIIRHTGRGEGLLSFLEKLGLPVAGTARERLLDTAYPCYEYDVLNVLKGHFVAQFYLPATDELLAPEELVDLARRTGGIATYSYLGDVGDSVTGDKAAQRFEDGYLDELLAWLRDLGFMAVTYAPTRNTAAQFERIRTLSRKLGFFQVSGEDINQPRQRFICDKMTDPSFYNLIDATWALIAHERLSEQDESRGLFSTQSVARWPDIDERVTAFAGLGRALKP